MTMMVEMGGLRFGKLTVERRDTGRKSRIAFWICACDCGGQASIRGAHLRAGSTKSCGCARNEWGVNRPNLQSHGIVDGEIWRAVVSATRYQVSDHGRVRNPAGRFLDGWLDKNGYPMVSLCLDDGRKRSEWVHIMVARAFIGEPPPGKECDHRDRDRANAKLTNLRYVTHQENIDNSAGSAGEAHGLAKLTEAEVREILAIPPAPRWGRRGKGNHPNSVITIAERYGISNVTVLQIRRGERWRHVFEQMLPQHPHLADLAKRRRVEPPRKKPGATAPNQTVRQAEPQPT